ncbi:hypothetical protein K2P97_05505 [bacterium]|nr:hypothetical protein [bacterium]
MKLSRLLELHSQNTTKEILPNNLGDAYLYKNNRIYRSIRDQVLKNGFSFSDEMNSAYLALPLAELENILQTKKIPYFNNVDVLKKIEQKKPHVATWEDVRDNLKKNFLFHESCHACARAYYNTDSGHLKNKVLNLLIEESFANTCELLAVMDAEDAAHRIFYEMNSYTALFELKTEFKNASRDLGFDNFAKIIFFGYLHSNHLHDYIEDRDLKRVVSLTGLKDWSQLSDKQQKTIKYVIKNCFQLDETFKQVTTRFYMKLNQVEIEHSDLKKQDYLSEFEQNSAYIKHLNNLSEVLTQQGIAN